MSRFMLLLMASCATAEASTDAGVDAHSDVASDVSADTTADSKQDVYIPMTERGPCKNCHKVK